MAQYKPLFKEDARHYFLFEEIRRNSIALRDLYTDLAISFTSETPATAETLQKEIKTCVVPHIVSEYIKYSATPKEAITLLIKDASNTISKATEKKDGVFYQEIVIAYYTLIHILYNFREHSTYTQHYIEKGCKTIADMLEEAIIASHNQVAFTFYGYNELFNNAIASLILIASFGDKYSMSTVKNAVEYVFSKYKDDKRFGHVLALVCHLFNRAECKKIIAMIPLNQSNANRLVKEIFRDVKHMSKDYAMVISERKVASVIKQLNDNVRVLRTHGYSFEDLKKVMKESFENGLHYALDGKIYIRRDGCPIVKLEEPCKPEGPKQPMHQHEHLVDHILEDWDMPHKPKRKPMQKPTKPCPPKDLSTHIKHLVKPTRPEKLPERVKPMKPANPAHMIKPEHKNNFVDKRPIRKEESDGKFVERNDIDTLTGPLRFEEFDNWD